jgi:type I restriction enzyme, S subunit
VSVREEKLGNLCLQIRGIAYGKDEIHEVPFEDTIPLLRATNILESGEINAADVLHVNAGCVNPKQILKKGDVLISASTGSKSSIGKPARVRGDDGVTFGAFCKALRPNTKLIDPDYFWFVFCRPEYRSYISNVVGGANINNIRNEHIDEFVIPLPSLATQKHIARVLEQADQLRKQAQQMESELNQLAQSLFLEMFGDLFRNPKAWPMEELSGLITQGPRNGLYKHADDYGTGSPIIRIDNFYDGELTNHSTFKRVAATVAELDKFKIDENSILINRVNSPDYLGKAALVERLQEPTVFESNMMNFSVDTDRINPLFLVTQLGSLYVKEQIRKASKDAVNQSSINQGDVESFTVALPPIEYQNKFARRLSEIRLVRSMCLESKAVVEEAFNSLMQRAFNGELATPERKAA